jgi:hypothetical protein
MKNPALVAGLVGLGIVLVIGGAVIAKKKMTPPAVVEEEVQLPVNTIPIEDRPYITLSPDTSGRNLTFAVAGAPTEGVMEYELVYNSVEKQEGVFGRLDLETEPQPIKKDLLLGSKSGGGKVTYHEGVTGGSLTVTYGEVRLKEQFNFLRFDPADPSVSSSDVHFNVTFLGTAFKKDTVVVVMKSFGLPAEVNGTLIAGPYAYLTPTPAKGSVEVAIKLPAGEHANPTIYESTGAEWEKSETTLEGDTVTATPIAGNTFIVVTE